MNVQARAKVNLVLRITGRRADGYHELWTLFDRISLADDLDVSVTGVPGVQLACEGDEPVHGGEDNLCARAATALLEAAKLTDSHGLDIRLRKFIPVGAGLGGGSSNAAAVLEAGNKMLGVPLDPDALHQTAAALGADVPFFLGGRMSVGTGIGDVLEPVGNPPPLYYVVLNPGFAVSTRDIFAATSVGSLTQSASPSNDIETPSSFDFSDILHALHNDLEPVTSSLHSEISEMKADLLAAGAAGASMSGSGPTVFGLFEEDGVAQAAYDVIAGSGRWKTFLARGE